MRWFWEKKCEHCFDVDDVTDRIASGLRAEMLWEGGWKDYIDCPPPRDALIVAMRIEENRWSKPFIITPSEMHFLWNMAGVYWKFTGIERMKREKTTTNV